MLSSIRSLKIELSEGQRDTDNRAKVLQMVEEEMNELVGEQKMFIQMIAEMTKNIYDHASAAGTLKFVINEGVCKFEVFDSGVTSSPVISNKGEGIALINMYANSLKTNLRLLSKQNYHYQGEYRLNKIVKIN